MKRLAIQGSQWGDEGKGKITDYFSSRADVVVRYQGGNNAGHTIVFDGKKYAVRLLPSGIFHKGVKCVLATGMVINPIAFFEELDALKEAGFSDESLYVSDRANVLLPYHKLLDGASERVLSDKKIGTTGRGIGPCYVDRYQRIGLRICDIIDENRLRNHLKKALEFKNLELKSYGLDELEFEPLFNEINKYGQRIKKYVVDTSLMLQNEIKKGSKILFEGAQGAMLCINYGTYPYVTSSSPMAISIPLNCGIPANSVDYVLGIAKAYTTRVGEGPFPSELFDELGSYIREKGHEYGTVTKRPRRVGWLDVNVLRYAAQLSGVNGWAVTLLDVLTGLDKVKICVSYSYKGEVINTIPASLEEYQEYKPNYIELDGWNEDISKVTSFDELPLNAKNYLRKIEELTGVKIAMFSVGPSREQTIIIEDPYED